MMPFLTYVVIPLASVLLIHFPSLNAVVFGWFDALQRIAKL